MRNFGVRDTCPSGSQDSDGFGQIGLGLQAVRSPQACSDVSAQSGNDRMAPLRRSCRPHSQAEHGIYGFKTRSPLGLCALRVATNSSRGKLNSRQTWHLQCGPCAKTRSKPFYRRTTYTPQTLKNRQESSPKQPRSSPASISRIRAVGNPEQPAKPWRTFRR